MWMAFNCHWLSLCVKVQLEHCAKRLLLRSTEENMFLFLGIYFNNPQLAWICILQTCTWCLICNVCGNRLHQQHAHPNAYKCTYTLTDIFARGNTNLCPVSHCNTHVYMHTHTRSHTRLHANSKHTCRITRSYFISAPHEHPHIY